MYYNFLKNFLSLLFLIFFKLFAQIEDDSLIETKQKSSSQDSIAKNSESEFDDVELVKSDTLNNQTLKNIDLNPEIKNSLSNSKDDSKDSLYITSPSGNSIPSNKIWTSYFNKNRRTQIFLASAPLIWFLYKFFQKEDEPKSYIGVPPKWPG